MKLLMSLFKKSRSIKLSTKSALVGCAVLISIGTGVLSCRMRTSMSAKKAPPKTYVSLLYSSGPQPTVEIARLQDNFCRTTESDKELWEIPFRSAFGEHLIQINYAFAAEEEPVLVQLDQLSYLIKVPHFLPRAQLTSLCQVAQTGGNQLTVNDETVVNAVKEALMKISPSCEFSLQGDRWQCDLKSVSPANGLAELQEIKRHMVTHWSRHPYLLTRRVAMAINLGEALTGGNAEKDLLKFCQVLTYSLPEELPLAFRTRAWRDSVCLKPTPDRLRAAGIGLHDARIEIETLKHELESASRLGTLVVRIPDADSPFSDYWVTLKPISDDDAPWKSASDFKMFSLCWHPLYHEDASFSFVAIDLGLINVEKSNHCRQSMVTNQYAVTLEKDYILASITSESEFPLTNGRGKVLRLPEGEYEYILQEHSPEEPWEAPPSEEVSRGTVSWKTKRPAPVINKW